MRGFTEQGKRIRKKLGSRRGETIAEVLVSVLISALALAMLAGMVSASSRLITGSKRTVEAYVSADNLLTAQDGTDTAGTVTFRIKSGDSAAAKRLADGIPESIEVFYYENGTVGSDPVISYRVKFE